MQRHGQRLCRYITRPPIATKRRSVDDHGRVVYRYKRPFRDGSTHVILEPLHFMYRMYGMPRAQGCAGAAHARLAARVPRPRLNLTRFHGIFAPNSKHRHKIVRSARLPFGFEWGVPGLGGPLVTTSGRVSIGAVMDDHLVAFALAD